MWRKVVVMWLCGMVSTTAWGLDIGNDLLWWEVYFGGTYFAGKAAEQCNKMHILNSLKSEVPVDQRDASGKTGLYYASQGGYLYAVASLLQRGAAVVGVGVDPKGTALHIAASWNQGKIAELLLRDYPDLLDQRDSEGRTALHHACAQGCVNVVKILLNFGANPDVEDEAGHNAWTHATQGSEIVWREVVTALKESEEQHQRVR